MTCVGCTRRVHKNYCVRYMKLSENLRAGMCNVCCGKVEDYILDVEEYSDAQGLTWNQESWVRRLVKSHSRGLGLAHQTFRPFNRLQQFLWTALGRGLVVRENYTPFAPVFFSSTTTGASSVGRTPRGPTEGQQGGHPPPAPPWQSPPGGSLNSPTARELLEPRAQRNFAARDAGKSRSKGEHGDGENRDWQSGKGPVSTPDAYSEVGRQREEANVPASGAANVPASGERDANVSASEKETANAPAGRQGGRSETQPEGRVASERSRSNRSNRSSRSHGLSDEDVRRLLEELRRLRARSAQGSQASPRTAGGPSHPQPGPVPSQEGPVPPREGAVPPEPEPVPPRNSGKSGVKGSTSRSNRDGGPSPNFMHEKENVWDQTYLAKALLTMKDAEFAKLDSLREVIDHMNMNGGFEQLREP